MIKNIRKWFYNYFLNKQLKHHYAERKVMNINNANDIAIIFDATNTDQTAVINQFADSLKALKKKIHLFGYYDIPKPAINFNFPYFNKKNLNWHLVPQGVLVDEFIERKFDILINASVEEILPLEYISAFSNASYRVGLYNPSKLFCYDLMIDLKEKNLKKLTEEVKYYLNVL